jgi:transposase-like protein
MYKKRRGGMYPKDIREKAVQMALQGVHLVQIQRELGPNPKATERYLKKAGYDYAEIKAQLKTEGKAPKTMHQLSKEKWAERKNKKNVYTQEEFDEMQAYKEDGSELYEQMIQEITQ